MNDSFLKLTLACPKCQSVLKPKSTHGLCPKCQFSYRKEKDIWHLLYIPNKKTRQSSLVYNKMHTDSFGGPSDGSYEILASLARGNKTVDIACGEGLIEKLSPKTVGVEFSINALKKAKKNGAKNLVLANAHHLPFKKNAFDLAICAGSLEHFDDPQQAISEIGRISKIQILTVHRQLPIPFSSLLFWVVSKLLFIRHQPIEIPIKEQVLEKMIKVAGLHIVFKGVWMLPFNYGRVIKFLPEFKKLPSCSFIISIKK